MEQHRDQICIVISIDISLIIFYESQIGNWQLFKRIIALAFLRGDCLRLIYPLVIFAIGYIGCICDWKSG